MSSNWLQSFTGKVIEFPDPDPDQINITDIAHALSMQCRFNGHVPRFYSVAEHSVLVSHLLPHKYALEGLLHDATEAYVGDLVRGAKNLCWDFRHLEEKFEKVIAKKFKLNIHMPVATAVKNADNSALFLEQQSMFPNMTKDWLLPVTFVPVEYKILNLNPLEAEQIFLTRFYQLWWLRLTSESRNAEPEPIGH